MSLYMTELLPDSLDFEQYFLREVIIDYIKIPSPFQYKMNTS